VTKVAAKKVNEDIAEKMRRKQKKMVFICRRIDLGGELTIRYHLQVFELGE